MSRDICNVCLSFPNGRANKVLLSIAVRLIFSDRLQHKRDYAHRTSSRRLNEIPSLHKIKFCLRSFSHFVEFLFVFSSGFAFLFTVRSSNDWLPTFLIELVGVDRFISGAQAGIGGIHSTRARRSGDAGAVHLITADAGACVVAG